MNHYPRKLFLICTGLGHVQRGFETYIQDLAEKLSLESGLMGSEIAVVSSAKLNIANAQSIAIPCIRRNSVLWPRSISYQKRFYVEQVTFFLGMLLLLLRNRRAVFYLGEYTLYCFVFKFRNLIKADYRLVLYTGGQVFPGLFNPTKDFIHHVTDVYLKHGGDVYPLQRQYLLPHFVREIDYLDFELFWEIKKRAGSKRIFLSVGVIDKQTKQMDKLLDMLSQYKEQVYPVILGEQGMETPGIKELAIRIFGPDGFIVDCVERNMLYTYYSVADIFVLLSPKESFGIAYVEALLSGKPVIARKFDESGYVLNDAALLVGSSDECVKAIERLLAQTNEYATCDIAKHQFAYKRYSWEQLRVSYLEMFKQFCA
jgi:glycosyltransferase involved in cell wall biosynthesis